MTTSISSLPMSDGGALHPLLWNETGLDGAACARPDLSHDWLRVAAGVYALRSAWQEAPWMERYELLLEAAHRKYGEDLVLAGASAVAAYGLPLVGAVLRRVEVVDRRPGRVRTSLLRRHVRRRGTEVVRVGGHLAVALPDSLIDLARWSGVMAGVAAMDAALHNGLCSADSLEEALERLPATARGGPRARQAVRLADGRSESPGESMSRVRMWEHRLPKPELQVSVRVGQELYILDYYWPDLEAASEFDGRVKYRSASFGQDPEDVVWREKLREDALRASGLTVARWTWAQAWGDTGAQMLRRLAAAGVRPTGRRW